MGYHDVLVPTDGAPGIESVASHAIELAAASDGVIHALAVVDSADAAPDGSRESRQAITEREGRRATGRLVERAEAKGVDAIDVLREGVPHDEVLSYAEGAGIDLIVMGTHGRSGLERVVLGSVTERVVRLSPVPVMTVRLSSGERGVATEERAVELSRDAVEAEGLDLDAVTDTYRKSGS